MTTEKWEWFGHSGHLIVGHLCRFHLCTKVGSYLVSTVGEYFPDAPIREMFAKHRGIELEGRGDARQVDYMKKIGFEEIGADRLYETMTFKAGKPCDAPDCGCGLPKIDGHELDTDGYNDAGAATKGHREMCLKWSVVK